MTASRWARTATLLMAVALGAGVGACAVADPVPRPSGQSTTAPPTTAAPPVGGLDFVAGANVDLGDGWVASPCEGGPSVYCVRWNGETQATIEVLRSPLTGYPHVRAVLDRGGAALDALSAEATRFQEVFVADRPLGCGAEYEVVPYGPVEAAVAGNDGISYGFDGHQGGRRVERTLLFSTIDGDDLVVITTSAIDDGSCLDDGELSEFTVEELTTLEPKLVEVIAASVLP